MGMTSDFEGMCKMLEKGCGKKSEINEIECARLAVSEYIDNDHDRYLKLKVEVEESLDSVSFNAKMIDLINFVVTSLTLIAVVANLVVGDYPGKIGYVLLLGFLVIILSSGFVWVNYRKIGKWRKYILAVLDECKIL